VASVPLQFDKLPRFHRRVVLNVKAFITKRRSSGGMTRGAVRDDEEVPGDAWAMTIIEGRALVPAVEAAAAAKLAMVTHVLKYVQLAENQATGRGRRSHFCAVFLPNKKATDVLTRGFVDIKMSGEPFPVRLPATEKQPRTQPARGTGRGRGGRGSPSRNNAPGYQTMVRPPITRPVLHGR